MHIFVAALVAVVFTADAMAMYHPGLGRYVQRDPHGTAISPFARLSKNPSRGFIPRRDFNPHLQYASGMSLYEGLKSNPLTYVDPSGLIPWYFLNGRAVNESKDRCAIVWSDFDGPWSGFKLLRSGDDTGPIKDQNDHIYFNGKWFKSRSKKVYVGEDDGPYRKGASGRGGNTIHIPLEPVKPDDDTKAPGKRTPDGKLWDSLPSEELCRAYCECNNSSGNQTEDCKDIEDCVKKCQDPWGYNE